MSMSDIVRERLREICPIEKVSEVDIVEVKRDCMIAFEVIGYNPQNFEESFQKTWESSDAEDLCDFIFKVWECDK